MTKAILALLSNRAVRTFIAELCIGITVSIITTLKSKDKNEIDKRVLLHMQERSPDSRDNRSETKMRQTDKRSKVSAKRESWNRTGGSKKNNMQ